MGMSVVVGAGPIGDGVARQLLAHGEQVVVVTRSGRGPEGAQRQALDVARAEALKLLFGASALPPMTNRAAFGLAFDAHSCPLSIAAVNAEKDEIEARIRYTLGEAKGGTCDGFKVSVSKRPEILTDRAKADLLEALPEYGTTVLDLDRLKDEKPELVKAAKQPLGTPRLTIKEVA